MTAPNLQVLNVPSKPESDGAAKGRSQKDRRYFDTLWDVHKSARFPRGRPWCGPRELAANRDSSPPPADGFCGGLMQGEYVQFEDGRTDRAACFASAWTAPWVPLEKYFVFNYQRKSISFRYQQIRQEHQQAMQVYYQAAAKLGSKLNLRVEYGVEPDFQIISDLGSPKQYLDMIALAEAAMANDPWLLGHIDEPNPGLAKILGFTASGLRVTSYTPPEPLVTPAQVLATPDKDLLAMIAEMAAQAAAAAVDRAFERRDAEASAKKRADAERMEKLRARRNVPAKVAV